MTQHVVDGQVIDSNQVGEGELSEEQMLYKENILEHYRHPRNKRAIVNPTAHLRDNNPFCGDVIEAYVVVDNGTVTDIAFQGNGCAISQASMSLLTERIKGMPVDAVLRMTQDDVLAMLGIPIGIVRRKCAMLGLRTVQKSLGGIHEHA